MASLEKFRKIVEKHSSVADFVIIYIEEAHPEDGWKFEGNVFAIKQHQSLEERKKAARELVKNEPQLCPIVVDDLSDQVNRDYGAVPERLYIILDGVIVYQGGPGPFEYKLREIEDWLEKYCSY